FLSPLFACRSLASTSPECTTKNVACPGWICSDQRAQQRILDRHGVVVLSFAGQDSPTGALDELSQETLRVCAVGGRLLWDHLAVIDVHFLDVRWEKHS